MSLIKPLIKNLHIIILSEVNLREEELEFYKIQNYSMFYNLRKGKSGGGLLVFHRNDLNVNRVDFEINYAETICFHVKTQPTTPDILIYAFYKPPKNENAFINALQIFLEKEKNKNVYIIGDMNIDLNKENDSIVELYTDKLASNGFYSGITEFTRERIKNGKITRSTIDHIFIRSQLQTNTIVITEDVADHHTIACTIQGKPIKTKKEYTKIKAWNNENINEDLKNITWTWPDSITDINQKYRKLMNSFKPIYKKHGYIKYIQTGNNIKKNKIIKQLLKQKNVAYKNWKKQPDLENLKHTYNKIKLTLKKETNKQKFEKIRNNFQNAGTNIKQIWKTIQKTLGKPTSQSPQDIIQKYFLNKMNITPKNAAENFAKTFIKEIDNITEICEIKVCKEPNRRKQTNTLTSFRPPSEIDIQKIIKKMNTKKSSGTDEIRMLDIVNLSENKSFLNTMTKLITDTIETSQIPTILKESYIVPIYKRGSHSDYNNYRPISILQSTSKILEHYIYNQIMNYVQENNIINKNQFGFQRGTGTTDLLIKFADLIHNKIDNKLAVHIVFIDYTKAFDCLNHNILLKKMKNQIGISGKALEWIASYLYNRKFKVKVGETYSSSHTFGENAVPQGSKLAPLLYLFYVNDMPEYMTNEVSLFQFADDTALVVSESNNQKSLLTLQENYNNLCKWSHDNKLKINASKSKYIIINNKYENNSDFEAFVTHHDHDCLHSNTPMKDCHCKTLLKTTNECTYLGLIIDSKFNFKPHINKIRKKLKSITFHLHNLKYYTTKQIRKMIYHNLIESNILYGLMIWGTASPSNLTPIQNILDSIVKTLTSKKENFDFLNLSQLYLYHFIIKHYFYKKEEIQIDITSLRPRKFLQLKTPNINNKHGKRTIDYQINFIFRQIPHELLNENKYNIIKYKIKTFLKNNKINFT